MEPVSVMLRVISCGDEAEFLWINALMRHLQNGAEAESLAQSMSTPILSARLYSYGVGVAYIQYLEPVV